MFFREYIKRKLFLSQNKKEKVEENEDLFIEQFKEEISGELGIDRDMLNKDKKERH